MLRTECSGLFQHGSFASPLAGSMGGVFSNRHCDNLVRLLKRELTQMWALL